MKLERYRDRDREVMPVPLVRAIDDFGLAVNDTRPDKPHRPIQDPAADEKEHREAIVQTARELMMIVAPLRPDDFKIPFWAQDGANMNNARVVEGYGLRAAQAAAETEGKP